MTKWKLHASSFLILAIFAVLAAGSDPGPSKTSPTSSPTEAAPTQAAPSKGQSSADAESARAVISKFVNLGFIKRMDVKTGKFYVDKELWDGFELDAKQNIVKSISAYREAEHGLPQVTLYESRSGKELANYGPFAGVTIR